MAGFTRTILIAHPVEKVFDFATNLDNAKLFMPGVTKIQLLTEGGIKPGARFRETRVMDGKERTADIEIVEHDRPTLHTAGASMMGMRAVYRFRFTPDAAGTRVDMEAEVTGNILWWLFLGMMSRAMEREDGAYLERLKAAIEAAETTPART